MAIQSSIQKNYIFNLLNTITGLLFPLITFPYVSRVLLADGIGKIQFLQSIIAYIVLFSALGIPLYAVREVARVRDNQEKCNKTTVEILVLHTCLTFLGYILVFLLAFFVGKIKTDASLFLLLSTNLFFSAIGVFWFYQAIEDFKYITIRSLVVRTCSLIALFLFVKTKDDLFTYALISVAAEVGSNLFNFFRLRKFITIDKETIWSLQPFQHLKPSLKIFSLNLIVSVYVNLDSVMLGFLSSEQAVGYYAAATRLTKTLLGVVSSLGGVLLPRFSNLINNNKLYEFRTLASKAMSFVIMLSLPMSVGLACLADPIIWLFCGPNFESSVLTLQLVSPIIFFIGLSGIIGMQILYPQGKENIVIIATLIGAIANFCLNLIFIPKFAQYGAGFTTAIAEFLVLFIMIIIGRNHIPYRFFSSTNMNYLIGTIFVFLMVQFIKLLVNDNLLLLATTIPICVLAYFTYLYIAKDELTRLLFNKAVGYLARRN